MLRRVENVQAVLMRDLWGLLVGGKYRVHFTVSKKTRILPMRTTAVEFNTRIATSNTWPVPFVKLGERTYWRYAGRWYWDNEDCTAEEVHALLKMRESRREDSINRAKSYAAVSQPVPRGRTRTAISNDVKQLVWARDQGSCRTCGSNSELQYDHVIPVALGGGSSEANIQLLCGPCNRRKGASIV